MNNNFNFKNIWEKIETVRKDIINELFLNKHKFDVYKDLDLLDFEILFSYQTYIILNSFLLKITNIDNQKINIENINKKKYIFSYYNTTEEILIKNHNNIKFNDKLFCLIKNIFYNKSNIEYEFIYKKNYNFKFLLKNIFYNYKDKKLNNKRYVFENNRWLSLVFDNKNAFSGSHDLIHNIDNNLRNTIKKCVKKSFSKNLRELFLINDEIINSKLSNLFADYHNSFLSISLLEGFKKKKKIYKKILNSSKIKFLHTCNGFLTSDSFKIFSIFAKKNGCFLIVHEHGIHNFIPIMSSDEKKTNFYKIQTSLKICDYYLPWGKINLDIYNNVENFFNVKIIHSGSVYLSSLKQINLEKNCKYTILFLDTPIRKYQITDLEDTFENIYKRKVNICELFVKLINFNKNIQIIYKPFVYDYEKNPINELSLKLSNDNFVIDSSNSINLMNKCNLILSDSLSTAFGESLSLKKPMLIYASKFEYLNTSSDGKIINENLSKDEKLFYDIDHLFNKIVLHINNKKYYEFQSSLATKDFQEAMAFPISKKAFLSTISNLI